jgi:hypothetical protein
MRGGELLNPRPKSGTWGARLVGWVVPFPPIAKCAMDGAPVLLGVVEGEQTTAKARFVQGFSVESTRACRGSIMEGLGTMWA